MNIITTFNSLRADMQVARNNSVFESFVDLNKLDKKVLTVNEYEETKDKFVVMYDPNTAKFKTNVVGHDQKTFKTTNDALMFICDHIAKQALADKFKLQRGKIVYATRSELMSSLRNVKNNISEYATIASFEAAFTC